MSYRVSLVVKFMPRAKKHFAESPTEESENEFSSYTFFARKCFLLPVTIIFSKTMYHFSLWTLRTTKRTRSKIFRVSALL